MKNKYFYIIFAIGFTIVFIPLCYYILYPIINDQLFEYKQHIKRNYDLSRINVIENNFVDIYKNTGYLYSSSEQYMKSLYYPEKINITNTLKGDQMLIRCCETNLHTIDFSVAKISDHSLYTVIQRANFCVPPNYELSGNKTK
jgi:hypothetical protein